MEEMIFFRISFIIQSFFFSDFEKTSCGAVQSLEVYFHGYLVF